MRSTLTVRALLVITGLAVTAGTARAEPEGEATIAYATLGVDAIIASVPVRLAKGWGSKGVKLAAWTVGSLAVPVAAGVGAHYLEPDPRPAYAIHGAAWAGTTLFIAGALIDGRDRPWQLRAGTTAWILGSVGVVGGAAFGATQVEGTSDVPLWNLTPIGGFLGGGLVLGSVFLFAGGIDGDDAPGQFAAGAAIGGAIGLAIGAVAALRADPADSSAQAVAPASPTTTRRIFSLSGQF